MEFIRGENPSVSQQGSCLFGGTLLHKVRPSALKGVSHCPQTLQASLAISGNQQKQALSYYLQVY